jgi:hypothetical protein
MYFSTVYATPDLTELATYIIRGNQGIIYGEPIQSPASPESSFVSPYD